MPRVSVNVESVTFMPRNHMGVHVFDLLAGDLAIRQEDVDADRFTTRLRHRRTDQDSGCPYVARGRRVKVCDSSGMAPRHDQNMSRIDRVAISEGDCVLVCVGETRPHFPGDDLAEHAVV